MEKDVLRNQLFDKYFEVKHGAKAVDFVNAAAQMGFQIPDQFLYEQLFLNYNLLPSRMQDVKGKIGVERMHEMFEKIKKIIIPKEVIPDDLYQQFLIQYNTENQKLERKLYN